MKEKPIVLTGQWHPTQEEIDSLRVYPQPDVRGRPVLFLPGREPYVSLLLAGRDGLPELVAGTRYFISIRGSVIGNPMERPGKDGRLRRDVWVYPWDDNDTGLPELNLGYLTRPLTVLEAWRACRDFVDLRRVYRDGGEDRILHIGKLRGLCLAELYRTEDREGAAEVLTPVHPQCVQGLIDRMDWESPEVERPDWRLL